jgi:FtsH-binding integral membrane protein
MDNPMFQPRAQPFSAAQIAEENAAFMRKVYAFMASGLGVTAVTSMVVASSETALEIIVGNRLVFYGLLFGELAMVWTFSALARKMSALGAGALFFSYALLNGLTFAVIFLVYTRSSIASTFAVAAGTFGTMSAYGYVTKKDLSGWGSFLIMGLFGIIIASLVNLLLGSPMIYWMTTVFGVLVFVGLAAYDTQKIKNLNVIGNAGTDEDHKEAIHGALVLYLDFINLFLLLLRVLGRRR